MIKYFAIIPVVFFCVSNLLFCQIVQFNGQLMQGNAPIKNYTLLIDGNPASATNDAGKFHAAINVSKTQLLVQTSDQKYIIIYPQGGNVLIPKDLSLPTQIFVAPFKTNDYLKEYLALLKKMKDSTGKGQNQLKGLQSQLDSITKILYRLSYTNTDLRSAREIQDGKDRNIANITNDLNDYVKNAADLISAFKYISDYAFTNSSAVQQLIDAVNSYNNAFTRLYNNKDFYKKAIADFWDNNDADSFQNVITLALDTIHFKKIYPLKDLLVQVREYFNTKNKSTELKNSIQQKITSIVSEDAALIEQLNNKVNNLNQLLTN